MALVRSQTLVVTYTQTRPSTHRRARTHAHTATLCTYRMRFPFSLRYYHINEVPRGTIVQDVVSNTVHRTDIDDHWLSFIFFLNINKIILVCLCCCCVWHDHCTQWILRACVYIGQQFTVDAACSMICKSWNNPAADIMCALIQPKLQKRGFKDSREPCW